MAFPFARSKRLAGRAMQRSMQMPARKAEELARIDAVARLRGGRVEAADTDPPDGYLVEPGGDRIPVEVEETVISAFLDLGALVPPLYFEIP